jgi:hypothetical protein
VPGGGVIEGSFFKVGDDAIKLFSTGLVVRNCVVWKLKNAAAFELGANVIYDLSNIAVSDSDVIRTEFDFPNKTDAVFAANYGGKGHLSGYLFDDIRVENASWQLFQISIMPNAFTQGNTELGSIGDLKFSNIQVADAQTLPDLFQSYNRVHAISNVSFTNVTVAGKPYPPTLNPASSLVPPKISYNANRAMSLGGDILADPLWRERNGAEFEIWLMNLGAASPAPQYYGVAVNQPAMISSQKVAAIGDFYGDGFAAVLVQDAVQGTLSLWDIPPQPGLNSGLPQSGGPVTLGSSSYELVAGWGVAGVGDFNGAGFTDILLWSGEAQQGVVLLMNGTAITGQVAFNPEPGSVWEVAGVGDFDQNGCSDILLRDALGDLEILYFDPAGILARTDFRQSSLSYASTSFYEENYNGGQAKTGKFDSEWSVAGVGDTLDDGYAKIVWENPVTGDLAVSNFNGQIPQKQSGALFARLPAGLQVQAVGDFNGDGAVDLMLRDPDSGQTSVWYLDWFNGDLFEKGPAIQDSLGPGWQIQGETP